MGFFKTIVQSIYSPVFYKSLVQKSFWSSFGYFSLFVFLLAIIQTAFYLPIAGSIQEMVYKGVDTVAEKIPSDLEIKIQKGQASINQPEPYFLKYDQLGQQNILVIDTKTPFSAEVFRKYNTYMWLTSDTLMYKQDNTQLRGFDLSNISEDLTLNKRSVYALLSIVRPYFAYITPVVVIAIFLGFSIYFSNTMTYLLLLSLVIILMAKMFSWGKVQYGTAYKIGLHAATLGLLLDVVVRVTSEYTHFSGFTFMFTLITLGVVFLNMMKAKGISEAPVPSSETTGSVSKVEKTEAKVSEPVVNEKKEEVVPSTSATQSFTEVPKTTAETEKKDSTTSSDPDLKPL